MAQEVNPTSRLATEAQVTAIRAEWKRAFGPNETFGPGELHQYTGRRNPAHLLRSEASLYLAVVRTKKTYQAPAPMTEAELAARVSRL